MDGGALYVGSGSSATFQGIARFLENTVISTDLPDSLSGNSVDENIYIVRSGGAIFNEVRCTFSSVVVVQCV